MKKMQLVRRLRYYAEALSFSDTGRPGEQILAAYIGAYIQDLHIADPDTNESIDHYIPQILVGAMHELVNSDLDWICNARLMYEQVVGQSEILGDPTVVSNCDSYAIEFTMVNLVKRIMLETTGQAWVTDNVERLLNAEREVLNLEFYRFMHRVHYNGELHQVITTSDQRGMASTYGQTVLRSWVQSGRLTYVFVRPNGDDEHYLSFVTEENDSLGLRSGLQGCNTDLVTALTMIREVTQGWERYLPQRHSADVFLGLV